MTAHPGVESTVADDRSSAPRWRALVPIAVILAASAPVTWFVSSETGNLLSAAILSLVAGYGVVAANVRPWTDAAFLVPFGGYWVGLVGYYVLFPSPVLLRYVLATPVVALATVIVLPQLVAADRATYTAAVTAVAVALVAFGLGLLALERWTGVATGAPNWVGQPVMGYGAIRTVSIYHNPNTFGSVMLVGTLTALYTALTRRGLLWALAVLVCVVGLVLSEGDHAIVGVAVGTPLVLSGVDRRLAIGSIGGLVVGAAAWIRSGHVETVMQTTFLGRVYRWVEALELLSTNAAWGIGFDRIGSYAVHNSYLHVPLATGLILGGLYVASLWYALGRGLRARWTAWTGYVVGTGAGFLVALAFESTTLGGVSVTAVLLGLYVGLLLALE
ncbi:O-antigen ligase domain-containing protein [Halovivax limisalsi]|uniref:O-antigen ligase domain-containing protein n=1 Tax=Halovivax limisalsi TaxID=1453760 RepID=UPI001FFCCCB6|nr:O-antigen ligase domain-containing protein [Halovivax limisalsi]